MEKYVVKRVFNYYKPKGSVGFKANVDKAESK